MDNVIALHPGKIALNIESPEEMLQRMTKEAAYCDKAVVVLITDAGGVWKVDFQMASMSNAETIISLDIVKSVIMDTVLGKCS